jgi:hypothetical protein
MGLDPNITENYAAPWSIGWFAHSLNAADDGFILLLLVSCSGVL